MKRLFLLLLLLPNLLFSQVTIKGSTKSIKEPLPFVNILLTNSDGKISGVASDIDSNYEITIPTGVYELRASFLGYKTFVKQIDVKDNIQLDILLEEETTELTEVTIQAIGQKVSEVSVVKSIRNSSVVSDGVSIDFIKKTPDRNVGDALKRVSGVTIQNDKFVLVRGLADRYNSAILNKTPLPSTEPDRRAFSFDIIPTALIDNIIVSKSASANQPGDWSGGLVQITTKEVSDNFFNISLGSGWGSVSTFRDFKLVQTTDFPSTFPSTYKYRISGNGDKRLFTKQIGNPSETNFQSIPNLNGGLSFGYTKGKFNSLFSSTIRNSFILNDIQRKDYQSSTELAYDYKDILYTKRFSTNGLLNLTYLGENRYSWKTLVNYQEDDTYLTRSGENYDNLQDVLTNSSNHINNVVINSQFDGKIKTWDFNLGYNFIFREQPDYRVNPITKSLGVNEPYATAWRDTYRFWSIMDENSFNGNINKELGKIKVGGGYLKKIRGFNARVFRYTAADLMDEITNNTDRYTADFDLGSLYSMYENEWGKWKLNTGVRGEYNLFDVSTADFSGGKVNVNREYLDVLPSLNLSYNLDKVKYRFSVSKTLARPEFREVANFAYYDFVRNAQILGNSNLEKTDIYNVDMKWELYPTMGENISVSVFGKQFIRPIEQIVADGSVPSNLLLTYTNPDDALLYGVELEFRKKITEWLDVYTNTSVMNSEVEVGGTKRQLQGQSNYVINGGVNIHKNKNTLNITHNRVGDRISAVGFQGYPDIFENSRDVLDITFLHKLKNGEIKLAIGDVFGQSSIYYQKVQNRNLIKTNNEQTISLTLNLTL
jgi:outer membrane receptor for ferrienterochelin and colicin